MSFEVEVSVEMGIPWDGSSFRASDGNGNDIFVCVKIPILMSNMLLLYADLTYLTYSRDDEDDVLTLWQSILRTVFLHVSLSVAI